MLIDDVRKLVQLLANKDEAGGYLPPSDYNRAARMAQFDIIGSFYNNPRGYQYELREPRKAYEVTNVIGDILNSLKVRKVVSINSNGELTEPSDYMHFDSAMVNYNDLRDGVEVEMTTEVEQLRANELADRLSSEIERPTKKYPVFVRYEDAWQFYPKDLGQVYMTYLKYPLQPWWNYTESNGELTFSETGGITTNPNAGVAAGNSTDFVLPEAMLYELVYKICQYMGITVREGDLYQASINQNKVEV